MWYLIFLQAATSVAACVVPAEDSVLFRCAPNALYAYFKLTTSGTSLTELHAELGGKDVPVSVARVKEICELHGVPSSILRFNATETQRIPFPAIAFIPPRKANQPGHFVVLLESSDEQVSFIDGTTGELRKWHHNTLWRQWKDSGVAIVPDPPRVSRFEVVTIVSGAAIVILLIYRGRRMQCYDEKSK